jgi:hypothetical protein
MVLLALQQWMCISAIPAGKGKKKGKDIPIPGHGGPYGCERLRLPHYLDKQLIDGGKVVSPMRWSHFTPRFLYF